MSPDVQTIYKSIVENLPVMRRQQGGYPDMLSQPSSPFMD